MLSWTKPLFDLVIIGSGPAAVAAISQLPVEIKVAVLTGSAKTREPRNHNAHAKIRTVASQRRETVGVTDPIEVMPFGKMLYSTSIVGGLANYWGQQFVGYEANDPLPNVFGDFGEYKYFCQKIESLFYCTRSSLNQNKNGFISRLPRLLIGARDLPDAGLFSMQRVFRKLCEDKKVECSEATVTKIKIEDDGLCLYLDDDTIIRSRRVMLAAGVIGSLRIVMRSFRELSEATFRDHTPAIMYVLDPRQRFGPPRSDGLGHLNVQTIECIEDQRVNLFSSIYRPSNMPIALMLAQFGLPAVLPNINLPSIMNLIKPIQLWTKDTIGKVCLDAGGASARISKSGQPNASDLSAFKTFIENLKGIILTIRTTLPGQGFHYFDARVRTDVSISENLSDYLFRRTNNRIFCVDASMMNKIGCRPPTLTAMAMAAKLTHEQFY